MKSQQTRNYKDIDFSLFGYKDGKLYWNPRSVDKFKDEKSMKTWNTKNSGNIAGNIFKPTNAKTHYKRITIYGKHYLQHRIIWMIHNGYTELEIDHIDGNGLNNDIDNLRVVKHIDNCRNKSIQSNNSSGVIGVRFNKRQNRYVARIGAKGDFLGYFDTVEEATEARKIAENERGYHKNHGRIH